MKPYQRVSATFVNVLKQGRERLNSIDASKAYALGRIQEFVNVDDKEEATRN